MKTLKARFLEKQPNFDKPSTPPRIEQPIMIPDRFEIEFYYPLNVIKLPRKGMQYYRVVENQNPPVVWCENTSPTEIEFETRDIKIERLYVTIPIQWPKQALVQQVQREITHQCERNSIVCIGELEVRKDPMRAYLIGSIEMGVG